MSFIEDIKSVLGIGASVAVDQADYLHRDQPIRDWLDGLTAELDATAVACIITITQMLASLDLRAVDRSDWQAIPGSDENSAAYFNRLMNDLDYDVSAYDFKIRLFTDFLLYGNAFVLPVYSTIIRNGRPVRRLDDMRIIPPWKVSVDVTDDGSDYVYDVDGGRRFMRSELLHFRCVHPNTGDRMIGAPPLARSSTVSQIARLARSRVLRNIKDGVSPFAVFMNQNANSQDAIDAHFKMMDVSKYDSYRLSVPAENIRLVDLKAQDADLRELRAQVQSEVAMAYGVPGPLIGINITQWGSGIEQLNRLFWRRTLRPMAIAFEQQFQRLVQFRYLVRFDESDILRGDWSAVSQYIGAVMGPNHGPVDTLNSVRHDALNKPPVDGGDEIPAGPQVVMGLNAPGGSSDDEA